MDDATPAEKMADGYKALRAKLTDDLLESLSNVSPERFEKLVVALLEKMGLRQRRCRWRKRRTAG